LPSLENANRCTLTSDSIRLPIDENHGTSRAELV
jgi:hypothetical protein